MKHLLYKMKVNRRTKHYEVREWDIGARHFKKTAEDIIPEEKIMQ